MEYQNCPNCGLPFHAEWAGGDESKPYCHGGKTGTCYHRVQVRSKAGGYPAINMRSDRIAPRKRAEKHPIAPYLLGKEKFIEEEDQ